MSADDDTVSTVRERGRRIGLSDEYMRAQVAQGVRVLAGGPVTDLDTPAPYGTRIQVAGQ